MCACKFKVGTQNQLVGKYPIILSAQNIADNRTKEILLCIYHTSPQKFKAAFFNVKIDDEPLNIDTDEDVIELANTHDMGNDVKLFNVDFLKIAKDASKKFTQEEINNSSCKIALSIN